MKKQSVTQKNVQEDNQSTSSQNVNVTFSNAFLLKGNGLLPLKPEFLNKEKFTERKFSSAKEMEQIIFKNSHLLFGERTFLIAITKKEESLFAKNFIPKGLFIDLGNALKPRLYFLDIALSNQDFYKEIFPRLIKFLTYFKKEEVCEKLFKVVAENKELRKDLHGKISSDEITDLLKTAFRKPFILLVSDNEIKELTGELKDVYSEMEQTVKCVFLRKFGNNGNAICTVVPLLSELHSNGKKRVPNTPVTEEFHLEGVTEEVNAVYKKIKVELLKIDKELQFNPQQYYISLRKDRNVAFFHISKKKINLVVKHPEKETRKQIKHYEILSLTEKVQKFWGGPSCTIVVDNEKKLQEIINLLKKLIKN